jgi:hypothetical protein
LVRAAFYDKPKVWKLLIEKGADLRAVDESKRSALTHYGCFVNIPRGLSPLIKAKRVAELQSFFCAGPHRSQTLRRKAELRQVAVLKRPSRAASSLLLSDKFSDVVFVAGGSARTGRADISVRKTLHQEPDREERSASLGIRRLARP